MHHDNCLPAQPAIKYRRSSHINFKLVAIACISNTLYLTIVLLLLGKDVRVSFEFLSFLLVYLNVLILALSLKRADDILDPYYTSIIIYSLYACSAAGSFAINAPQSFPTAVMRTYYIAVTVGLIGMILGYQFFSRNGSKVFGGTFAFKLRVSDESFRRFLITAGFIAALGNIPFLMGLLDAGNLHPYTEIAASSRLIVREDPWGGTAAYIREMSIILLFSSLLFSAMKRKTLRLVSMGVVVFFVIIAVRVGSKSEVLLVSLMLLMYIHYRVRPLRIIYLVGPALALYIFAVMINNVRFTTSLSEMTDSAAYLIRDNPSTLLPTKSGELIGPPESLLVLAQAIESNRSQFTWGYSYLTELAVWVPRSILPDRPLPLSEQYMELFYRAEYDEGGGHAFFIASEGYWAFGIIGVLVHMFAFGMVVALLHQLFLANKGSDAFLLMYALSLFVLVFMGVRTGLILSLKTEAMVISPFVFMLLLSRQRRSRRMAEN